MYSRLSTVIVTAGLKVHYYVTLHEKPGIVYWSLIRNTTKIVTHGEHRIKCVLKRAVAILSDEISGSTVIKHLLRYFTMMARSTRRIAISSNQRRV